jgi:Xaa-Pro aminopeptidase
MSRAALSLPLAPDVSDLTRLVVTGRISPKLRKVYGVVLRAPLDAIRPGVDV